MIRGFDIVYQLYEKGLVCESINWIINLLSSYNELVRTLMFSCTISSTT